MPRKKSFTQHDLKILVSFLSDPNPRTAELARNQLKKVLSTHPETRSWLEEAPGPSSFPGSRQALEEWRRERLFEDFTALADEGDSLDLEQGAYLLASFAFPGLQKKQVQEPLDHLALELEKLIDTEEGSSEDEIRLLRKFLFTQQGFHGNRDQYYDPDNSYLNRVLERRTGIPISLSCVYLLVADRVDIDVYGIGLPGHFIVGHKTAGRPLYVDPYHNGRWLTRQDCVEIVRHRGIAFRDAFLEPTPNAQILARMIVNLVNVYTERGATDQAQWLSTLMALFQESA